MRKGLLKLAGVRPTADGRSDARRIALSFTPLAAPFLILFCEPRWELAAAAACWSGLMVPGLLAANRLFPPEHAFASPAARPAVTSVLGLLPFGVIAWAACLFHWTLTTVLIAFAVFYFIGVILLAVWSIRGDPPARDTGQDPESLSLALSGWAAAGAVVGVCLILIGVAWSTFEQPPTSGAEPYSGRESWRLGSALATAGSLVAAASVVWGQRRARRAEASKPARRPQRPAAERLGVGAGLLWLIALALTVYVMKAAYALPQTDPRRDPRHAEHAAFRADPTAQRFAGARWSLWNSDDVTYVSEAVDYRYGLPLGKYEPSLGAEMAMSPVNVSPLIAPLVAAISRVTGIDCAALQHSVLCPLMVLLGASALAAALAVLFRGDRWAVPLGLIVALMMVCKSWDYERSMVEFTVWRAMQSKSVHLWLIHPLQLATLILLAVRPSARHLAAALAVALVGHLVHPFSTIVGAVWSATALGLAAAWYCGLGIADCGLEDVAAASRRRASLLVLIALAGYGLLGAAYKTQGRIMLPETLDPEFRPSSGREADEPEQSRDLVRVDGRPVSRQEPQILFGYDVLFNFGAAALPLVIAVGASRREWLCVGLMGIVALAVCNVTPLGRLVNSALPTSLLWRARWMLPSLAAIAAVAVVLHQALATPLRRRAGRWAPAGAFAASLIVLGAFAGMLAMTESVLVKVGPAPRPLSKFSPDMHGLVDLLGGREAVPFVWGPREVTRELPQLMPHVRLALSREKIMRPAAHPRFRDVVLGVREKFRRHALTRADLDLLLRLYPIDHIVLETVADRADPATGVLREAGWQDAGRSGQYHVWRNKAPPE